MLRYPVDPGSCQDHHIEVADYSLMQSKTLPDLPFKPITVDCLANVFFGDGQTKTRHTHIIHGREEGQMRGADPAGIGKNAFKLRRAEESGLTRKTPGGAIPTGAFV